MYFLSDFFQFWAKSSMYGAKLNICCTGLMDGSPNYGMKPMKRVERNDRLLIMLICLIVSSSFYSYVWCV